jgi:hypothetical protein
MREHAPFLLRLILATASANDVRLLLLLLQQGQWILRMLEIRRKIGRGSSREPLDTGIFDDRFVEVDNDRGDQRQNPADV